MTAPIVYVDTRGVYEPRTNGVVGTYLADGDYRVREAWSLTPGQLWERLANG